MIRASILSVILAFSTEAAIAQTAIELQGAQPTAIPRTADGHPDFGGQWQTAFITSTGRMEGAKAVVASDVEAKEISGKFVAFANSEAAGVLIDPDFFVSGVTALSKVNGEWRTSLITSPADGVQHYTDAGRKMDAEAKAIKNRPADGPEARPLFERCMVGIGSAPLTNVPSTMVRQFVQTRDHLMIYTDGNDTRIIGFNAPPRPAAMIAPLGDSRAFWEDDVLVVHTTGLTGQVHTQIITRPQSRVIERFEMISPDEILYQFTVEDTAIYAEPFMAEFVMHRSDKQVLEYACHEGNYSMTNMLQAARVGEKKKQS